MDEVRQLTFTLRIRRKMGWQDYRLTLPSSAYLLDALEQAGKQDHTLLFRHACHHASCGSCGLRVDGRERLACITPLTQIIRSKKPIRLEPLRNFPWIGDLLVDFGPFMERLAQTALPSLRSVDSEGSASLNYRRFENCIECGLCLSACPVAGHDPFYLGPAALAAAWRMIEEPRQREPNRVLPSIDSEHGVWRCHAAFECTEVCPANVDPAGAIMSIRQRLLMTKPQSNYSK